LKFILSEVYSSDAITNKENITMSAVESNYKYYFERCDLYGNDLKTKMEFPNKSELIAFLEDIKLHKNFDYINDNYEINNSNFRQSITESFVLTNDDAREFLTKASWASLFRIIKNQTIIPLNSINYYVANRVIKINDETYYMFIKAIRVDIETLPKVIKDYVETQIESNFRLVTDSLKKFAKNDLNFVQFLMTQIKYDNELFTKKLFN
jgi:hypothetical protein